MNRTSLMLIGLALVILVASSTYLFRSAGVPDQNITTDVVFEYRENNSNEIKTVRVEEGQNVTIKAISDVADEAHLHGYDISTEVGPGEEAVLEFIASETGRFPLELEEREEDMGIIEVYPR